MKIADMSVELVDHMGSDLSVVNAARVSFAKESTLDFSTSGDMDLGSLRESDQRLISYLASHGHWSPFAHAFVTLRIKAPVFVARQMVKHQVGLSWNEESRRYIDEEPEFHLPNKWRAKPEGSIKQGSGNGEVAQYVFTEFGKGHPFAYGIDESAEEVVEAHTKYALKVYNALLYANVAPEQARMVLPLNTMTNWIWSGSLMAFARVCRQRLDPHAQLECQEVAQQINKIIEPLYPHSWKALLE